MKTAAAESTNFFDDEEFQDRLAALLVSDIKVLHDCAALLTPDDFRPLRGTRHGRPRWVIAELALEYYQRHHEPLGRLLRAEALEYARRANLGSGQENELRAYTSWLAALKVAAPESITEKVVRYKTQRIRTVALEEMVELQATGQLTPERWQEITQRVLAPVNSAAATTDYLATLPYRVQRRRHQANNGLRIPFTYIDPLDSMARAVGGGEIGLALAPYGRGKSMFLLWIAAAYAAQGLNVLYFNLEDPQSIAEDRLDSIVTGIPLHSLKEYPQNTERRFARWRAMIRSGLRIFDGTGGGVTVTKIEQVFLAERNRGFLADAIIVDYDEEIAARKQYREKRFELDETYRDLRQLMGRYSLIGWTAAQTKRGTQHLKILSGDLIAEDISKMKKVTFCVSLGRGEWTEDSIFLWIAKHRVDKSERGCEIVPDLKRSLIYDHEATLRAYRANVTEEGE